MIVYLAQFWYLALGVIVLVLFLKMDARSRREKHLKEIAEDEYAINRKEDLLETTHEVYEDEKISKWTF